MDKTISVRLALVLLLLWGLLTVAFGWMVWSTTRGSERSGKLGEAAVAVASFPSTAKWVLVDLYEQTTGEIKDKANRTERPPDADYGEFEPVATAPHIDLAGLLINAEPTRIADGWRLLAGAFILNGEFENAALLLSPELVVVHAWVLDEIPIEAAAQPRQKYRKFVHGIEILPDGSLIFTFDGSMSLQRFGRCGERQWTTPGTFHHAVSLSDAQESVWTLEDDSLVEVSVADGTVLRRLRLDEVIKANPMMDILEIRRAHDNALGTNAPTKPGDWLTDPHHFNDVDPLPPALANRFPGFQAGDLVVSSRSLNLVYVIDPQTLQIKWWRAGAAQRQHDPDWLPSGDIMIFNNRMSRGFSEIVALDPVTLERSTILDGRQYDFYTRIRGKQQMLRDGTLVVTSPQQGRAFEVDAQGDVVLEVANTKPGTEQTNYVISELRWLPPDYFETGAWTCVARN